MEISESADLQPGVTKPPAKQTRDRQMFPIKSLERRPLFIGETYSGVNIERGSMCPPGGK